MSVNIDTYLWLSPKDHSRKDVREILDGSWNFEYEEDEQPDSNGMIKLDAREHSSYDELRTLTSMGVPFIAYEDSRLEADGAKYVFVSWRRQYVYALEDGSGNPVIPIKSDGNPDKNDLSVARLFWKLRSKVVAYCRKHASHTAEVTTK